MQKPLPRPSWLLAFLLIAFTVLLSPVFAAAVLIIEPDQGRQPILDALRQAQTSIDLAMYGFTDPELMRALIQSKEQGKKVRVLLQHYPYRSLNENQLAIQRFTDSHLNLAFAPGNFYLLHQKTLLLDQHKALVLSFNFTRAAFKKERNFGLLLTDPDQVQEIQSVFNADWEGKKSLPQRGSLLWSPDNSREKIINLINKSKREVKVYAQGLTDDQVLGALRKAAGRGVKVQVLTSGIQPSKKWDYLKSAGVIIAEDKRLIIHAKVLLIDKKQALLGSINFTAPSLDKNRELSVLLTDPEPVKALLAVFEQDWADSSTRL